MFRQHKAARFTITASAVLMALVLVGCNGTITSLQIPADSPWSEFLTILRSPYPDLVVLEPDADNYGGEVILGGPDGTEAIVVCEDANGEFTDFFGCGLGSCDPAGLCAPDAVREIGYIYTFVFGMDRGTFTSGSLQIASETAGTVVGGISLSVGGNGGLNISAGVSDGLFPASFTAGDELELFDDFATLVMFPNWSAFQDNFVCLDGTQDCEVDSNIDELAAICFNSGPFGENSIFFRVDQPMSAAQLDCGDVPVQINFFKSVGECISSLKKQNCSGLKGKDRAACNHAQIGACHATFGVPSSHSN
jgi:hypothetical protein